MPADDDLDTELDIDLLAAELRAEAGDVDTFVEALAAKLEEAVPGAVTVQRRREGIRGPRRVQRISIDGGGQRLELQRASGAVQTTCSRLSGGIVLKREQLDTDAWLIALGRLLAEEADRSSSTRRALDRLLNQ